MALEVPNEIKRGDPILADFLNGIVRATKANRIMPGVGILTSQNSGGTTVSAIVGGGVSSEQIFFGKPTSAFSSGTTVTLDPCDIGGTDNGAANVTVYLKEDQSSLNIGSYDAGAGAATTGCTLPTTAIVAYMLDAAGDAYVLGEPVAYYSKTRYYATTHYFQAAVRWMIGLALSTESDWLNIKELTQVNVVTDVTIESGTGGKQWLKNYYRSAYHWEIDGSDSIEEITDTEESQVNDCSEASGGGPYGANSLSSNTTLAATNRLVFVSGNTTLTLPTAVGNDGREFIIKKTDSGTTATIAAAGGQTIDGSTTISMATQYESIKVVSDGANWFIT